MDVRQQEYFVAIVEEGSISNAAKRLYISQPTLSQFLSKLEKALGVKLVVRSSNTLSLTKAGQLFYETSKKMLALRDDFERALSDLHGGSSTKLVIGNTLSSVLDIHNDVISALSIKYPELRVTLQDGNPYQLQEKVLNGTIDMGFSSYNHKYPQLEYLDFPAYEMMLVLHKDHPLAHLGSDDPHSGLPHLPLKTFENERFILTRERTIMGDIVREYCDQHGIQLNTCIETYGSDSALVSVSYNLGIGIFPPDTLGASREGFKYIGMDPPLYYNRGLYYNKSIYQTAFFRDYIRMVRRRIETKFQLRER